MQSVKSPLNPKIVKYEVVINTYSVCKISVRRKSEFNFPQFTTGTCRNRKSINIV